MNESSGFYQFRKSAEEFQTLSKKKLQTQFQFRSKKKEENPNEVRYSFTLSLKGTGISLVSSRPHEFLYMTSTGINLTLNHMKTKSSVLFSVDEFQIDDPLPGSQYPFLLTRQPPKSVVTRQAFHSSPVFQSSLILATRTPFKDALVIPYCSLLLQAMKFEFEASIMEHLTAMFFVNDPAAARAARTQEMIDPETIAHPFEHYRSYSRASLKPPREDVVRSVFLGIFQIQPTEISLSHVTPGSARQEARYLQGSDNLIIQGFLNVLNMALGNIEHEVIHLNALELQRSLLPLGKFLPRVMSYITQQTITELYKLLGSANLPKNPGDLFAGYSQSVDDLFYEPHRGTICTEADLHSGVNFEDKALKKMVSLFDDVTRLTVSRGKGAGSEVEDSRLRRTNPGARDSKPRPTREAYSSGAASIAAGFGSGLAGLFSRPVEGMIEGGALGFVKGLGQGAVGVVTKPIAGIIDGVSKVTQSFSSTQDDRPGFSQKRLQRHIDLDRSVGNFNERKALGARLLHDLGFKEDFYVAHIELNTPFNVESDPEHRHLETLVLSSKRLLLVEGFEWKPSFDVSGLQVDWTISMERLWEVECTETTIFVRTDNLTTDKQIVCPDVQDRVVSCPFLSRFSFFFFFSFVDAEPPRFHLLQWFANKIQEMKEHPYSVKVQTRQVRE